MTSTPPTASTPGHRTSVSATSPPEGPVAEVPVTSAADTSPAATPDPPRRPWRQLGPRGWALDVGIAVVLAGLLIANGVLIRQIGAAQGLDLPGTVSFVSGTVMCLLLVVRRLYPLTVLVGVAVAFTIYGFNQGYDAMGSSIALFVATVSAGSHGRAGARDVVRGAVIAALFGTIFYAFLIADRAGMPALTVWFGQAYAVVLNLFYFAAGWVFGDQIRLRRQRDDDLSRRTAELTARTVELEAERELSEARAADAERLRIARELHDVLGHHVSVMGVQAGAARRVLDQGDQHRASESLAAIEGSSRQAVTELQRVLRLLREEADQRQPLGHLGRIEELAQELRRAGLSVTTQLGELPPLPVELDLAAVRVVQESLTNALRHAGPGSSVWVRVTVSEDAIELEISDDGRGTPLTDLHGGPGRAGPPDGVVRGSGLRGMRERVELHGGRFEAGPTGARGWRVRASIPVVDADGDVIGASSAAIAARGPS